MMIRGRARVAIWRRLLCFAVEIRASQSRSCWSWLLFMVRLREEFSEGLAGASEAVFDCFFRELELVRDFFDAPAFLVFFA